MVTRLDKAISLILHLNLKEKPQVVLNTPFIDIIQMPTSA